MELLNHKNLEIYATELYGITKIQEFILKCGITELEIDCKLKKGSGYFAVDGNLPLESILP